MANTEGMSDETMERLLVSRTESTIPSMAGSAKKTALERRLELPMGERPAARVVRSSTQTSLEGGRSRSVSSRTETSSLAHEEPRKTVVDSSSTGLASPTVMGDVIELKASRRREQRQKKTANARTESRFALSAAENGFPSVHVPLGKLVKLKTKSQDSEAPSRRQAINTGALESAGGTMTSHSKEEEETSAIQRQAQAMLEQMSPAEIRESVQDLHAALTPDTLDFLKRRGQQKHALSKVPQSSTENVEKPQHQNVNTNVTAKSTTIEDDPVEKHRVAQVLSSIRTYEDMDAAYTQEVKERFEFSGPSSTGTHEDTFDMACDLLRSSLPRQNLWAARTVSQRLQEDVLNFGSEYALGNSSAKAWPYPVLLPVSLRCLLDASVSKVNGLVLHTYVLHALYGLLRLRSSGDHVHGANTEQASVLYQEYFLDDAIPTPPLHSTYSSTPAHPLKNQEKGNYPPVAYATTSSSASAQQDGQAFLQDPLWTLLSRMRILPRLAELLQEEQLTVEAVIAACGILTLVAQRSPGAATAIVQHPSLLRDLTDRALTRQGAENATSQISFHKDWTDCSSADPALTTLFLGCTLARQSRTAAEGLDTVLLPRFLPLLVSATPKQHSLQQWALVLWRTRLRYGLSLADLPTVLTLAAPHCALGIDQLKTQGSLAPFFFSAFAVILNSIRAIKVTHNLNDRAVNEDDKALLSQAGVWLSSSKRQALEHLTNASSATEKKLVLQSDLTQLQYLTSILRYLDGWVVLSRSVVREDTGEFKSEDVSEVEEEGCLQAILSLLQDVQVKRVVEVALRYCFQTDISKLPAAGGVALAHEAASCSFVDALLVLATSISNSFVSHDSQTMVTDVRNKFLECLRSRPLCEPAGEGSESERPRSTGLSRRFWLNRTHAALVRFLSHTMSGPVEAATHVIGLSVIGRLEKGEESVATLLFSCDNLFYRLNSCDRNGFASPISTFFVRELCLTDHSRSQLDHSFKLRNALGLTSEKMGPFDAQSLRSEVDGIPSKCSAAPLLHMGSLWLWKVFGGLVVDHGSSREVEQVLLTALELVYELERTNEMVQQYYVQSMDLGGRLYFLMNLCLQPFLEQERIRILADDLIDRYTKEMDSASALGFADECLSHSAISSNNSKGQTEDQSLEGRQAMQLLHSPAPALAHDVWDQKQLLSVESFIGDLCDAFLGYGAQYSFFTKCLRSFLCSGFPSKVRCNLIERIRDFPHLLALPEEEDLPSRLLVCVSGGRSSVDQSLKDTPQILDACTLLFRKGKSLRPGAAFMVSWATAMLARSLAIFVEEECVGGLSVSKRRIMSLEQSFAQCVLQTTEDFLASHGAKQHLVDISVRRCRADNDGTKFPSVGDDHSWNIGLTRLRKTLIEAQSEHAVCGKIR